MAKQTFTTGQVLTAAQMTSLQQTAMLGGAASAKTASYTLVAADAGSAISMSNASATTITVNTALFAAGDTVHITNLGAGVCTITAGTATVNSSASLALAQYESGFLDFTSTSAAIFVKGAGAAAASGASWTQANVGNEYPGSVSTFTISGISNADKIMVFVENADSTNTNALVGVILNTDTTAGNYQNAGVRIAPASSYSVGILELPLGNGNIRLCGLSSNASSTGEGYALITGCTSTNPKVYQAAGGVDPAGSAGAHANIIGGFYLGTSAISSISVVLDTGTFVFGTRVRVYTSA